MSAKRFLVTLLVVSCVTYMVLRGLMFLASAGPLIDSGSGDLRLQLPDSDGTSDVSIEDSSANEVAAISSDGEARFTTSNSGVVVYLSTDATVTVSGKRAVYINNDDDAIEFDLPADPTNCFFCFRNRYARAITIDPEASDYIILGGTAASAGEAIVSTGAASEFICLVGIDSSYWMSMQMDSASSWSEETP